MHLTLATLLPGASPLSRRDTSFTNLTVSVFRKIGQLKANADLPSIDDFTLTNILHTGIFLDNFTANMRKRKSRWFFCKLEDYAYHIISGFVMRHGGQILTDQLESQGVIRLFCVPSGQTHHILDGLYDSAKIETIICRHERGAALAAEAHSRLTGESGILLVGEGSAALNAIDGIYIAAQDKTPMILLVALRGGHISERPFGEPFDFRRLFNPLAKWVAEINITADIPAILGRAFHLARSGCPGPVVLGIHEQALVKRARLSSWPPVTYQDEPPQEESLHLIEDALHKSVKPLMIIGGPKWSGAVSSQIHAFAELFDLPIVTSAGHQHYFDNRHQNYIGGIEEEIAPHLMARVRSSDLILALGTDLQSLFTAKGKAFIKSPTPKQFIIHIHPEAAAFADDYRVPIAIQSSVANFAATLEKLDPPESLPWQVWRQSGRADYEDYIEPRETPGALKLEHIIKTLSDHLDEDAIICEGAGNYTSWLHRYFQYKHYGTQLGAIKGAKGYGLPAAIAAKLEFPERQVIALAGDGCFMTTAQELATAAQYGTAIIVLIINNRLYGKARMRQQQSHPDRVIGTHLGNPDFAALAKSFGAFAAVIERTRDFRPAFKEALACGKLALLELQTDPEAISAEYSLSDLRNKKVI